MTLLERFAPLIRRLTLTGMAGLIALGSWGCLGESTTSPDGEATVPVSISFTLPFAIPGPESPRSAFSVRIAGPENTMVVEELTMAASALDLKPADRSSCASADNTCVEYLNEPVLLDLPTSDTTPSLGTQGVGVGRYDQVILVFHAPSPGSSLAEANPEFEDVSLRAEGTFNGEPFVFETSMTPTLQLSLDPALTVAENTRIANLTIRVNLMEWFRNESGRLVNPSTAVEGGENQAIVEANIRDSFEVFRDDDRDGLPGSGNTPGTG